MSHKTQKSGRISELLFPCPKAYVFFNVFFWINAYNKFCGYHRFKIIKLTVLKCPMIEL